MLMKSSWYYIYRTGQEDDGGLMLGARNTTKSPGRANLSFFL